MQVTLYHGYFHFNAVVCEVRCIYFVLKFYRVDAGMTQEQIANELKTTKSVISRMENHATDIRLSTLEKFAKVVGRHIHVALV